MKIVELKTVDADFRRFMEKYHQWLIRKILTISFNKIYYLWNLPVWEKIWWGEYCLPNFAQSMFLTKKALLFSNYDRKTTQSWCQSHWKYWKVPIWFYKLLLSSSILHKCQLMKTRQNTQDNFENLTFHTDLDLTLYATDCLQQFISHVHTKLEIRLLFSFLYFIFYFSGLFYLSG